jgi:hypothetical protein
VLFLKPSDFLRCPFGQFNCHRRSALVSEKVVKPLVIVFGESL